MIGPFSATPSRAQPRAMPISPLRRSTKQSTLSARRFSLRCSHRGEPSSGKPPGSYLFVEWALLESPAVLVNASKE